MSATNHTPNIGLSQFIGTDKPTWLGDYNSDMEKIDKSIGDLVVGTSSIISSRIDLLEASMSDTVSNVAKNAADIAVNTSSISAIAANIVNITADINTLDTREAAHFKTLSENQGANNQTIQDLQDKQTYFNQNMDRIESLADAAQTDVTRLETRVSKNESDIADLQNSQTDTSTDISTIRADVAQLTAENLQQDTAIKKIESDHIVMTASIASNTARIVDLEKLPSAVSDLETSLNDAKQDITNNMGDIASAQADIETLQKVTANIAEGVAVPFGFGETADGKKGFINDSSGTRDSVVVPFATLDDIADVNASIKDNADDITILETRTANITAGKALPYSLAIAQGGAYGYIKNGETGVTPFVTADDVADVVNIQPIQADVNSLKASYTNLATDVNSIQADNASLSGKYNTLDSDVTALTNTVDGLSGQADDIDNAVKTLEGNVTTLSGNVDTLTGTASTLEENVTTLSGNVDTLTEGQGRLTSTVNSLNSAVEQINDEITDISSLQSKLIITGTLSSTTQNNKNVIYSSENNITLGLINGAAHTTTLTVGSDSYSNNIKLPFSLGIDSEGNYGYIKAGADTVTPFLTLNLDEISVGNNHQNNITLRMNGYNLLNGDKLYFINTPRYSNSANSTATIYTLAQSGFNTVTVDVNSSERSITLTDDIYNAAYIEWGYSGGPITKVSAIVVRNNVIIGAL